MNMPKMSRQENDLYNKWCQWIRIIESEIYELSQSRQIFWDVQKIIGQNAQLHSLPGYFNFSMKGWYERSQAAGVRRLADKDPNTVSLHSLIGGIKRNPSVITRDRFCRQYANDHRFRFGHPGAEAITQEANALFDSLVGAGRAQVDPQTLDDDIRLIEAQAGEVEAIKAYVDKRIAHRDKMEAVKRPHHSQLDTALDLLISLYQKYSTILTGRSVKFPLDYLEDWTAVFKHPWIAPVDTSNRPA